MKKIIVFFVLILNIFSLYAESIVKWNTVVDLPNITSQTKYGTDKKVLAIKKGTEITYFEESGVNYDGYESGFENDYYISALLDERVVFLPIDSVVNKYCKQKFPVELISSINNKYIDENTLISFYTNNLNYLKEKYPTQTIDEDLYKWDDHLDVYGGDLYISNIYIRIFDSFNCADSGFFIKNIRKENTCLFYIQTICNNYYHMDNFYKINPGDEVLLILEIDNDYIHLFLNNVNTLFKTYVRINNQIEDELNKFVQNKQANINGIVWPRHADGTCDYDGSSKKGITANTSQPKTSEATKAGSNTNVAVKKTMTTNCNLKLRSGEATSTQVLTIMSAGTNVKILELGKAETIDGINSNWVRVEVLSGSKDRDGKEIKAGTVGWCYGGYLE